MRVVGTALVVTAVIVGLIAAVWTLWRAIGAEVDYCAGGGRCTSAYAITVPAMVLALIAAAVGVSLIRRRPRD